LFFLFDFVKGKTHVVQSISFTSPVPDLFCYGKRLFMVLDGLIVIAQKLMEDVQLVENKGSGIDAMLVAMQKGGLPAPVFVDNRASFMVKFYQAMPAELTEEEQRIIVYVKEHGSIKRSEA
jgi:hypothetical protein